MGDLRELTKSLLIAFIWFLPIYVVRITGQNKFLWLFVMSFMIMMAIFNHYEDLNKK